MNSLFFELIRVALGNADCLSHMPSGKEWKALYEMATKQSIVGVCFAALQRLGADADEGFVRIGMSEMLYLSWMGMTANIQQRNELVNRQCVDLQRMLSDAGFRSCILKGEGVGQLYSQHLLGIRQSGDIDLWVEGTPEDTIAMLKNLGIELCNINIKHADAKVFEETEVEIHFVPSWFYNPMTNRRFKAWIKTREDEQMANKVGDLVAPTAEFNAVYLLLHIYRHLLDEGVGMRQLMDYYFALNALPVLQKENCYNTVCSLGMRRIASAVMWIMQEIFGLDNEHLLCEPDVKEGSKLLNEILKGGNFGHYDKRKDHIHRNAMGRGWRNFRKNQRYLFHYPSEVLWSPVWKVWHWCWRKQVNK